MPVFEGAFQNIIDYTAGLQELPLDYVYRIRLTPDSLNAANPINPPFSDVNADIRDDGVTDCGGVSGPYLSDPYLSGTPVGYIAGLTWVLYVVQTFAPNVGGWVDRFPKDDTKAPPNVPGFPNEPGPVANGYNSGQPIGPTGSVSLPTASAVGDNVYDDPDSGLPQPNPQPNRENHTVIAQGVRLTPAELGYNSSLLDQLGLFNTVQHYRELALLPIRCPVPEDPPNPNAAPGVDILDPVDPLVPFNGLVRDIGDIPAVAQEGFSFTPVVWAVPDTVADPPEPTNAPRLIAEGAVANKETAAFELRVSEVPSVFRTVFGSDTCDAGDPTLPTCNVADYDNRYARLFSLEVTLVYLPTNTTIHTWEIAEQGDPGPGFPINYLRAYSGQPGSERQYDTVLGDAVRYNGVDAAGSITITAQRPGLDQTDAVCCSDVGETKYAVTEDLYPSVSTVIDRHSIPLAPADGKAWQIFQFEAGTVDANGVLIIPCTGRRT